MHTLKNTDRYAKAKTLTKAILMIVEVGTILAMALMAPNALQILKPFLGQGKRKDHERKRIRQALDALHRQEMLEYFEKRGKTYLRITQKGRTAIRRFDIDTLVLPQQAWDKKWRVIFFDIPEQKGHARRVFQRRLEVLGCMRLQKSTFIYPHACHDQIDSLTSFWDITLFVHYFETANLGTAQWAAEKFFHLS